MKQKSTFFCATRQVLHASLVFFVSALGANAATFTWDGGGVDTKASTAANWVGDTVPLPAGYDIIFSGTSAIGTTVNWDYAQNFRSLTFDSAALAYTIGGATPIQFVTVGIDSLVNNSANTQTITGTINIFFNGSKGFNTGSLAGGSLLLSNVAFRGDQMSVGQTNTLTLNGANNGVVGGTISTSSVGAGVNAALVKSGAGTWTLNGSNNYAGNTTISGGTLKIGNAKALGFGGRQTTANGTTTVGTGFTLDLNGTTGVNEVITLNGTGIGTNGALINSSGTPASITSGIAGLTVPATGLGTANYSGGSIPAVVISGTGTGATATASLGLKQASINSITAGGTGWVTGDTVNITGGGGTGAVATVTATGGVITALTLTSAGAGYTTSPTTLTKLVSTAGGGTTTISGNATNFTVGGITVTNAGTGYTGTPTFTFAGVAQTPTVALSAVVLASASSIGGAGDITISPVVSGAFDLSKVGAGTVVLAGTNTFSGKTLITAGVVRAQNSASLGTSVVAEAQSTVITSGAALEIDGSLTTTEFIRVAGTGISGNGAIRAISGTTSHNSQIAMEGTGGATVSFGVDSGAILKVNRLYSDPGRSTNFEKVGSGTLVLKADNSDDYVGNTTITGGSLQVGDGGTTGELKITGIINNANLTFNRSNGYTYSGDVTGTGSLTKLGAGVLLLSSASTYTGATTVTAGTLLMGDAAADTFATSGVTVASGATLGGSGVIAGTVGVTGILAPGNSGIGTLAAGTTTWNGAAVNAAETIWQFDLGAATGSSDTLAITGNFKNDSTAGSVYKFNFMNSAPSAWGNIYTLATWTGSTDFTNVNQFSWTGLSGAYSGLDSYFTLTGVGVNTGGSLTFTAVPEPTNAFAGLLIGAGLLRRRRSV